MRTSTYWKEKILREINLCYAQGEWGGENPEDTFKTIYNYYSKYNTAKYKEKELQKVLKTLNKKSIKKGYRK